MPESLLRLVYYSRSALPADPGLFSAAIREILEWSRDFNKSHEITGSLMFSEGFFAQVLEGPPDVIKATLGHICCDPRHRNLRLLECLPTDRREFPSWAMAFIDASTQIDLVAPILAGNQTPLAADILAMMQWFVRESA
jgi:hypothetical protein